MSDPLKLKFVFANHDGLVVEVEVTDAQSGRDLKNMLMDRWPEEKLEKVTTTDRLRLICMGKILPDNKQVKDMKIPRNAYPTPVNVVVRPKDVPLEPTGKSVSKTAKKQGVTSSGCTCAIM